MNPPERKPPPPIVWWAVWGAITAGWTVLYLTLRPTVTAPPVESLRYLPVAPFCVAVVVRWLILPRFEGLRGFPIFIIGVAMAESTGIFGLFLVPSLKDVYFALALVGLAQFVPVFVGRERA
jgi:hypothetical protein